jgi:hypothetical protein
MIVAEEPPGAVLAEALSRRELSFAGDEGPYRAERGQQEQRELWLTLLRQLPAPENVHRNLQQIATQQITGRSDLFPFQRSAEGSTLLKGLIPLIDGDAVNRLLGIAEAKTSLVWAALLVECLPIFQNQNSNQFSLQLIADTVRYFTGDVLPKDMSHFISNLNSSVENSILAAHATASELKTVITRTEERTKEFLEENKKDIDAFKRALSEDIKLKASSSLWASRAAWHRLAAIFWFIAFSATVVGLLVFVVQNVKAISDSLPREADGHFPYVSVIFVLIPALGAAWFLRLISRFINSNQLLADDARHRQAMTRAYLALVADKNSKVTENDRLVMLTALFRPLPGGQSEDVAPPSILDILKRDN